MNAAEPVDSGDSEETWEDEEAEDSRETDEELEAEETEDAGEVMEDGAGDESSATSEPVQEEPDPLTVNPCVVIVNGAPVTLFGKSQYIFVDIFERITFDLRAGGGRAIVTLLNGREAQYTEALHEGDEIELYWEEKK
jgi:hypothetical protein